MIKKFLRSERPFLIALLLMLVLSFLIKGSGPVENQFVSWLVFGAVFFVIIYAAIGVVHHAELLAFKFGEPYGTMILTISAVTVEVIMVTAMMLNADDDPTLARDAIFSTVMILLNGLTGIIMLVGGFKFGELKYNLRSSNSYFSMIFGILGLSLFIPIFIKPGFYHSYQVFLVITASLLYIFFLRMQSKEHNYYFRFQDIKIDLKKELAGEIHEPEKHEAMKKDISTMYHIIMLLLTITVISFLAETLSLTVDNAIDRLHWPAGVAGLIIAIIIISPEGLTAFRAGLNNDMQRVVNISLGSVLSTISVTVPAVLIAGMITRKEVILGLEPIQSAMIIISLLVGVISYKDGETNALQGVIHFVLFITFVVLIFI